MACLRWWTSVVFYIGFSLNFRYLLCIIYSLDNFNIKRRLPSLVFSCQNHWGSGQFKYYRWSFFYIIWGLGQFKYYYWSLLLSFSCQNFRGSGHFKYHCCSLFYYNPTTRYITMTAMSLDIGGQMFFVCFLHNSMFGPSFELVIVLSTTYLQTLEPSRILFNCPVLVPGVWHSRYFSIWF